MNYLEREQQEWECKLIKMTKKFYNDFIYKHYSESTCLFIRTIAHRVYKYNKNALIITCGASGSGKSYVDLELLRGIYAYVNGEFPPAEYVVDRAFFKLKDFLEILNTPEMQDSKNSRGQIFISEEMGTQAGSRTFQNIANRTYSYIVQTFRAKGMIIFFNVPSFNFIDSQVRKQIHYLIETKTIDNKNKTCIARPLELQYNSRMDKIYYHNLTATSFNHESMDLEFIDVPKIPKEVEILYESKKSDFINNQNMSLQTALNKMEEKDEVKVGPLKELTPLQQKVKELLEEGLLQKVIAEKTGRTQESICGVKKAILKKGYVINSPEKPLLTIIKPMTPTPPN